MATDTELDEQLNSPLRNLVLRSSNPQYLKKLRVKRKRIRNYFGGAEAIKEIAVTVATVRNVVGIKISASSRPENGKKFVSGRSQSTTALRPMAMFRFLMRSLLP